MSDKTAVISHWHYSAEDTTFSSLDFFRAIEEALAVRQVPVARSRVEWNEGSPLSAKREYLRLGHGRLIFDISAFPFGTDYYFSWWLTTKKQGSALYGCFAVLALPLVWLMCIAIAGMLKGALLALIICAALFLSVGQAVREGSSELGSSLFALPYIGSIFEKFLHPTTYYSVDSRIAFEECVHRIVIAETQMLLEGKGLRALSPEEVKVQSGRPLA